MRIARLLRLTRMARLVRVLRAVPELMILVKGMIEATRSVCCALVLMLMIVYAFAIALTQVTKSAADIHEEYFATVSDAIATLFMQSVLPDQMDPVSEVFKEDPTYGVLMLMCILLTSLTALNMLVGTLVEVVRTVGVLERESLDLSFVKDTLQKVWEHEKADADQNGLISTAEFFELLHRPKALRALQSIGVDVVTLPDVVDCIFESDEDGKGLGFSEFMDALLELRASNKATVKDINSLRRMVLKHFADLKEQITECVTSSLKDHVETIMNLNGPALSSNGPTPVSNSRFLHRL